MEILEIAYIILIAVNVFLIPAAGYKIYKKRLLKQEQNNTDDAE